MEFHDFVNFKHELLFKGSILLHTLPIITMISSSEYVFTGCIFGPGQITVVASLLVWSTVTPMSPGKIGWMCLI